MKISGERYPGWRLLESPSRFIQAYPGLLSFVPSGRRTRHPQFELSCVNHHDRANPVPNTIVGVPRIPAFEEFENFIIAAPNALARRLAATIVDTLG